MNLPYTLPGEQEAVIALLRKEKKDLEARVEALENEVELFVTEMISPNAEEGILVTS